MEIQDITDDGVDKKELYCTKCEFRKTYGPS
ncbi:hypothetical protein NITUZ_60228 [Candidatus Nitrosotenuis uzonensis]|uniref:Uncharacterized protein n=1 Tax=Candidatus Nitrosotenuis uzonensis TaxID=1407055 RepID=V6AVT7_9ARCH|nr:hypothetical protein NITUZ_60228 [Candidatus Nitrosotenuis uzonensis]